MNIVTFKLTKGLISINSFIGLLYNEFLGNLIHVTDTVWEEYFQIKCCSYFPKDIDTHIQQMSKRFYLLGGLDDPNLKQA